MDGHPDATEQVAIAKLDPTIPNKQSCYLKAVVTLLWPYSPSSKSLSVLLAEPDIRLRRSRGQVKVQFLGSSAKHVFDAGIGSGDELVLSLNGAEWVSETATVPQTPGSGIEWELKFAERLVLQIRQRESGNITLLNLDNPPVEPESNHVIDTSAPPAIPSPPQQSRVLLDRQDQLRSEETSELSSPAFIKRARLSYGSFIGSDFEAFMEDDGPVSGRARKRTKFGRASGDWKYISRSPSPESEPEPEAPVVEEPTPEEKPAMTDGACQTDDLEYSDEMQEFFRQSQAAGREARNERVELQDTQLHHSHQVERQPAPSLESFSHGLPQLEPHEMRQNETATAQWPESIFRDMGFSSGQLPVANLEPNQPYEQRRQLGPQTEPMVSAFQDYREEQRNGLFQAQYPPGHPVVLRDELSHEMMEHYDTQFHEPQEVIRDSAIPESAQPVNTLYPELPDISMEAPVQPAWESLTRLPGHTSPIPLETPKAVSIGVSMEPHSSRRGSPIFHPDTRAQYQAHDSGSESEEGRDKIHEEVDGGEMSSEEEMNQPEFDEERETGNRANIGQYPSSHQILEERRGSFHRYIGEVAEEAEEVEDEFGEEDQPSEEELFSDDDEGSDIERGDEDARYRSKYDEELEGDEFDEFDEDEDFDDDDERRIEEDDISEEDVAPSHPRPGVQAEPIFIDLLSSDDEEDHPEPKPAMIHQVSSFRDVKDNIQDNVIQDEERDEDEAAEYERESEEPEENQRTPEISQPNPKSALTHRESSFADVEDNKEDYVMEIEERDEDEEADYEEESEEDERTPELLQLGPKPSLTHQESSFGDVEDNVQDYVMANEEHGDDAEAEFEEGSAEGERTLKLAQHHENEGSKSSEGAGKLEDAMDVAQGGTPQAAGEPDELDMQPVVELAPKTKHSKFEAENSSIVEEKSGYEDEDDTVESLTTPHFMDGASDSPHLAKSSEVETFTSITVEHAQEELVDKGDEENRTTQLVEMELDQQLLVSEAPGIQTSEDELLEKELDQDLTQEQAREHTSIDKVVYPSSPQVESYMSAVQKSQIDESQEQVSTTFADDNELINAQLMTPEATQVTSTMSRGSSFKITTDNQSQSSIIHDKVVMEETTHSVEGTEPTTDTVIEVTKRVIRSKKGTTDGPHSPATPLMNRKMSLRSASSPISAQTDRSPSVTTAIPSTAKGDDRDVARQLAAEMPSTPEKRQQQPETPKHNLRSRPSTSPTSSRTTHSQELAIELPITPKGLDARSTPTHKDLRSLSKQPPLTPEQPLSETALRARLTKALRTNLGDFTPLKLLRHNLGKRLDILAIATTLPPEAQRAKHGPRHYHLRFNVTDPSVAPAGIVEIQVFRPYKEALPDIEIGDGVLLRNFSVKAEKDRGFALRSEDTSSWAVFKHDRVAECRGPPVEFGEGEEEHVARLKEWWGSLSEELVTRLGRVGESPGSAKGKVKANVLKARR